MSDAEAASTETATPTNVGFGVDVGGSGIKGGIVDLDTGELVGERFKVLTPQPSTPEAVAGGARARRRIEREEARLDFRNGEATDRTGEIFAEGDAERIALGRLDLDHVGAHPCEQLGTSRARLDMCEIQNSYTVEGL